MDSKQKLVILDYSNNEVFISTLPSKLENVQIEEVEKYLVDEMGYNLESIDFMYGDGINVKIDIL